MSRPVDREAFERSRAINEHVRQTRRELGRIGAQGYRVLDSLPRKSDTPSSPRDLYDPASKTLLPFRLHRSGLIVPENFHAFEHPGLHIREVEQVVFEPGAGKAFKERALALAGRLPLMRTRGVRVEYTPSDGGSAREVIVTNKGQVLGQAEIGIVMIPYPAHQSELMPDDLKKQDVVAKLAADFSNAIIIADFAANTVNSLLNRSEVRRDIDVRRLDTLYEKWNGYGAKDIPPPPPIAVLNWRSSAQSGTGS